MDYNNNNGFNNNNDYPGKSTSIAALVLGIVSVVCAWNGYISLISIGTGIAGLMFARQAKRQLPHGAPTGMATAGFVLSIVGLALGALIFASCAACAACAVGTTALGWWW